MYRLSQGTNKNIGKSSIPLFLLKGNEIRRYFFMQILLEKLLLVLVATGVITKYIAIGFIGMMLIQLISYRKFNFNIYKTLLKKFEQA